ncbi:MAG TPA: tyrosine--tRNA ligase [Bacteroidales bacterium]|nr:tyrosine--tRNA ligase [Bacteroidales bacterium]HQI45351.1 tyrosine--tRNA ligase [Bacteroidales bacterium]
MKFVDELRWRGMLHDIMPGTEELLNKEMISGYIGFDPTSDSLGVGNLVQIMTLLHFQRSGHKPFALVGGATGMVGDPSGKSSERNLLSEDILNHNLSCQKKQLEKFLDFGCGKNAAEIVNNYDWFKEYRFLDFIRDIGKHITISYMMTKDSVKNRLEAGMSFTEFSYQLVQGYDFYYLNQHKNCKLQMGGSDQWGNIVTGTELIRRKSQGEAYALTTPLITKADGTKFGKSENGNVWLDPNKTSPYRFYQFWLNASDEDVSKYIRIFTLFNKEEIEAMEEEHKKAPHLRMLQKALAKDITIRVHSEKEYISALNASEILFGKGTTDTLKSIDENTLLSVFEGVPMSDISINELSQGIQVVDFLTEKTNINTSKNEARRMLKEGCISINKQKIDENFSVSDNDLLNQSYILVQKGKKNYFLVKAK